MSRRIWKAVETEARKSGMAKVERRGEERRSKKKVRNEERKEKRKDKKRKDNKCKEDSRRVGNLG